METLAFLGLSVALGVAPVPIAAPPPHILAQLADSADERPTDESADELAEEESSELEVPSEEVSEDPIEEVIEDPDEEPIQDPGEESTEDVGSDLRLREALRPWHILSGSLTWASITVATVLGFLHFNDRWGFTGDPTDTGCAGGDPILGTEFCPVAGMIRPATPHFGVAIGAAVSFTATFTMGLFMPDPLDSAGAEGGRGNLLRIHKALRWVVLAGMVAQLILGPVTTALSDEPFETGRGLAVTHLAVGTATWASMAAQGIVGSLLAF